MLLYGNWLRLSLPTRQKIAQEFNITKKGPTHVVDNVVKDDGYPISEVEAALSVDNIQKFLNTDEGDINVLWERLVYRIDKGFDVMDSNEVIKIPVAVKADAKELSGMMGSKGDANVEPKKKRGRPAKVK